MYLGKALQVSITGFDRQAVIDGAANYCKENNYMIWRDINSHKKWMGWFTWKDEYKIELYKPIDYEINRLNTNKPI